MTKSPIENGVGREAHWNVKNEWELEGGCCKSPSDKGLREDRVTVNGGWGREIKESFQGRHWWELCNVEGEGHVKEEPKVCSLND